jgi:hypothetical protein
MLPAGMPGSREPFLGRLQRRQARLIACILTAASIQSGDV